MKRTRALDILARAGIPHEVREFAAHEFTVEEAAEKLGLPLGMVFKTLLVRGERKGLVFALTPGDAQLSLSKLAKAMGDKRAELADVEDLFRLTGYLKGGCAPLGAKRDFPVFMDQSAMAHARICVSAGLRGVQVLIAPADLQRVTRAIVADIRER
ncbi:MAG: Cys-tRNA(Pro) deacylase [Anaerolineae bacterium]|nr:Cys-tRNA(Pro) deacylase [Candidatus Roseilinea sp.]MDW8450032.1 Cys-tRNA(Pro) deacylase [Anaerolineae bacterium]